MIIISQEKNRIINFENIQTIAINRKGSEVFNICSGDCGGNIAGYWTVLGQYKSEERAKEVLQEIVNTYAKVIWDATSFTTKELPKVYEMPKE